MPRSTLGLLLRVRQAAYDEAQRDVERHVRAEAEAEAAALAAERSIQEEVAAASALTAGDEAVDSLAVWLPAARRRAGQARAAHDARQAETARSRAVLAAHRTGLETVETLLRQQQARLATQRARAEQHALEEAAARVALNAA